MKANQEVKNIKNVDQKKNFIFKTFFLITGIGSLVWFIIRVIPKPSRATYPCMKAAMPIASSFIIYLITLFSSVVIFKNARKLFKSNKIITIALVIIAIITFSTITVTKNSRSAQAGINADHPFNDPLGVNAPIGQAKGIYPGRVVWIYDPNATNENCTSLNQSDAYYLDKNTNQEVVDEMVSKGILELTGEPTLSNAWDAIFNYFNKTHSKGEVGYNSDETIFIKINAVTAWSGATPNGDMPKSTPVEFDTSPQTILSMLRQLINEAGIPEEKIFIGDPMADIWNILYDKFYAEFPNINYVSKRDISTRYKLTTDKNGAVFFADKGSVLNKISEINLFTQMKDADYILNFPTMKGHRWAGVTFFAKNHFGSNTADEGSWRMHPGLMNNDNNSMRYGYNKYRVLVDLMGSKYLGGKTLLYFMDALWSTSYEHQPPQKFRTAPFNNDWSSSVLFSLDPVAIESVCLDILQKEFTEEEIVDGMDQPEPDLPDRWTFVQWDGIDDYLHQAASREWWPEGIIYDPDNSGDTIPSLGVHEHWNNTDDMEYSRNMGTGEGIELVKFFYEQEVSINKTNLGADFKLYPNPCNDFTNISLNLDYPSNINIEIISTSGQLHEVRNMGSYNNGLHNLKVNLYNVKSGTYFCRVKMANKSGENSITKKLVIK